MLIYVVDIIQLSCTCVTPQSGLLYVNFEQADDNGCPL